MPIKQQKPNLSALNRLGNLTGAWFVDLYLMSFALSYAATQEEILDAICQTVAGSVLVH